MLQQFDGGRTERVWDIVRGNETFVYQYDPETKQQSSVWFFPGESSPGKFERSKNAVFFVKSGHVDSVPCQERKVVYAEWYMNIRLPKVFEARSARRPNDGAGSPLLHHDNASAHTAAATPDYLEAIRVQLITLTPYPPGLAPCDFFLIPQVKQQIKEKQFQGVEDARAFFEVVIPDMPQSTCSVAIVM